MAEQRSNDSAGRESPDQGGAKGKKDKPYDLDERTALFGEAVIDFAKIYRS